MKKILALLLALHAAPAFGQAVQQSGFITPGHGVSWIANGVVGDSGAPSGGVGLLGSFVINDMLCASATGTSISVIDCGFSATGTNNWVGLQNFNGGATAPTRSIGDNTTNVATTAFVINIFNTPNIWIPLQTFIGGIIISPTTATLTQGLNIVQSGPTSGSGSGILNCLADLNASYCFNNLAVSADAYNLANSGMNAFAIDYAYGGSNLQGARNGLTVYSHLNSAGSPSNPNPFYGAINSVWEAFAPDTSSSAAVNVTAFTLLQTGATGFHSIEGMEIDTGMVSSGGAAFRVGLDLASIGAFQGASGDYAVAISSNTGDVKWLNGISFNRFNGIAPLDATNGCAICTDGNSDTIKTGMDFSSYTITGNFLKGPGGFFVDGAGNLDAKSAFIYGPATGGPVSVVVNNQDGTNTAEFIFDAVGVPKWEFGKNGSGNFFIFDDVGGQNVISATANGGLSVTPVGATTIGSAGVRVNVAGQLVSTAGLPTIASGTCGATTNGAVVAGSTNQSGNITIGSATTTTCTLAWSATLSVVPNACVFYPANAAAAATGTTVAFVSSITNAHVILTGSALANANYGYICL